MPRSALLALCLFALAMAGCGGGDSETDHARKAAETYVRDLGARDGEAVCADMTRALQKQFTDAVGRANPEIQGRRCGLKVAGKVAKEGEAWRVSCCVPGQDG